MGNNILHSETMIDCTDETEDRQEFDERYFPKGVSTPWTRGGVMRVVLSYVGPLPAKSRPKDIHAIRRVLHPQIKSLWNIEDPLRELANEFVIFFDDVRVGVVRKAKRDIWIAYPDGKFPSRRFESKRDATDYLITVRPGTNVTLDPIDRLTVVSYQEDFSRASEATGIDHIASGYTKKGFRFVPIATESLDLMCHLEILVFRQDGAGLFKKKGGDMDNRIKALIDALRVPSTNQLNDSDGNDFTPGPGEDPFYCLLEDDGLITGMNVRMERWLESPQPKNPTDVHVSITASIRPSKVTDENRNFLAGWF